MGMESLGVTSLRLLSSNFSQEIKCLDAGFVMNDFRQAVLIPMQNDVVPRVDLVS